MRIGSLFSGYGGLDIAVHQVTGATTAWVSDIDPGAVQILAHRFPDAPNLGDISTIDWSDIDPVEIITAGFPCQDVSMAGRRAGLKEGTRTGLWSEVVRAITELQPRMVVLENVLGIFTAPAAGDVEPCAWCVGDDPGGNMRALDAVLADLAEIGFDAEWTTLRASDVGAAHRRERWFCIAYPASDGRDERRGYSDRDDRPASRARASEPSRVRAQRPGLALLPTPSAYISGGSQHPDKIRAGGHMVDLADVAEHVLLPTPKASDGDFGLPRTSGRPPERATFLATRVHYDMVNAAERWGDYAPAIARWEQLTRPAPDPTEPTGRNGAHRLPPRFTEWLMGLPDGWITDVPGITRNQALKACGNGVVPQQAAAALTHLLTRDN